MATSTASLKLRQARQTAGLGLREAARLAGTSHATFKAYETGAKTPSVTTFLRLVEACSFSVDLELKPRIRSANGLERGNELLQVLELAEQFPSKYEQSRPELSYPVLSRLKGRQ